MVRKGNLPALKKAVRMNPNMTQSARRKALSSIEKKITRARARGHRVKSTPRNLGVDGFEEAGMAGVKLASHPIEQAIEVGHLVNGLNKIRKWLGNRSR